MVVALACTDRLHQPSGHWSQGGRLHPMILPTSTRMGSSRFSADAAVQWPPGPTVGPGAAIGHPVGDLAARGQAVRR